MRLAGGGSASAKASSTTSVPTRRERPAVASGGCSRPSGLFGLTTMATSAPARASSVGTSRTLAPAARKTEANSL